MRSCKTRRVILERKKYLRNYYLKNKKKLTEYQRRWRKKNREKYLENQRKWHRENREKCREYAKKNYEKNKDYYKNYFQKNKEKFFLYRKEWHHRNKIKAINYLGSKCIKCGIEYDGKNACIFQLHHRSQEEKRIKKSQKTSVNGRLGKLKYETWSNVEKELDLCDLLCANCHFKEHYEEY